MHLLRSHARRQMTAGQVCMRLCHAKRRMDLVVGMEGRFKSIRVSTARCAVVQP